jgi:daunorubicin resistance ABC transporter ATP-binding subunit
MMRPAIEAEGLVKSFGNVRALDGIDMVAREGTVFGLLGPNGAGKTTAIRVLSTLLRPDAGRATVGGFDVVRQHNEVRRLIGLTGQYAAVDELLSGHENLYMLGRLLGLPVRDARARAAELLVDFDLADAATKIVKTYSGGMRRRLDLASALVHQPIVLFLDEPTTGLDPVSRKAIWEEVAKLNDEGTTVFLTTQYLEEADQLADRVGIISEGKIVAQGTPAELKAEIRHPHLEITLLEDGRERAEGIVSRFGRPLPAKDEAVLVELEAGASGIAPVVRALDEAGLAVESLHLVEPTLDDVFAAKTGYHLEGAEGDTGETEAIEA